MKIEEDKESYSKREKPNKYLLSSIKETEEGIKNNDFYSFKNNEEAIKFLNRKTNE